MEVDFAVKQKEKDMKKARSQVKVVWVIARGVYFVILTLVALVLIHESFWDLFERLSQASAMVLAGMELWVLTFGILEPDFKDFLTKAMEG